MTQRLTELVINAHSLSLLSLFFSALIKKKKMNYKNKRHLSTYVETGKL